jgi:hypothetical protein
MRTPGLAIAAWLAFTATAAAQQFVASGPPDTVRYAVVDGGAAGKTMRLDRTSGRVWWLETMSGQTRWVAIPPVDGDEPVPNGPVNYQLYVSREYAWALLLNVHSGATWRLEWQPRGDATWIPISIRR